MSETVLRIRDLHTQFALDDGVVKAVNGVDLDISRGETLAVVGESGCGKSVMARSVLRLVDRPGRITGGEIWVRHPEGPGKTPEGAPGGMVDLVTADKRTVRSVRGKRIAMVFQEPMTSMSPMHTLGNQIGEAIRLHEKVSKAEARRRTIDLLGRVDIPDPKRRVDEYPFQMSGGMLQRAMIAMALSCNPELLIADEPTTALDVTTQARILELLRSVQEEFGMAVMLITHDLGVAAQMADRIAVMYLGSVVERGDVVSVFRSPRHPYTKALLRSIPKLGSGARERLRPVRGMVPHTYRRPPGCPFHPRCDEFLAGRCDTTEPLPVRGPEPDREVRCLRYEERPEEAAATAGTPQARDPRRHEEEGA
ncbi:ABC transporter ATP-binding protein [Streptomyces hoynatensis]|uniref:ABC transporter ATP-binding protein n=1 Tax=Streptomyces hoynatensis TaxID=1141874 RepID=A0A3A9ZAV4_9ACTN|nr:ABC transporter ATP-binding protein [Streptomyces hoynatensis]RKN44934.1 ABC transporter ATP-binding protein [Streptomyces hoynatensis]